MQLPRHEQRRIRANHLHRAIAEDSLRRRIPARDDAVQVLAEDGVGRGIDDRGELDRALLSAAAIRHVRQDAEHAARFVLRCLEDFPARPDDAERAILPDDAVLHVPIAADLEALRETLLDPLAILGMEVQKVVVVPLRCSSS
jgi:hypothetical protein